MDRLRQWCIRNERTCIFVALLALFVAVYFGAGAIPPWRTPILLTWDPVWRLPFIPAFIVPYTSAYVMPLTVFALPDDRKTFRRLAAAFTATVIIGGLSFIVLPLAAPRPADVSDGLWSGLIRLTYSIDATRNLFPSLHVAISFLTAFALGRFRPRWRAPMLLWAALIAASTLFVRQHYAIDVLGGLVLAVAVWRVAIPRARPR
uniref:PAP2 superfamily protein n=1 Tax=uncultured bacterium pA1 TaxID=1776268 RepID=A0A0U3UST9_9BACT|nr:PAP2 superfamily protein [uncultured bacterium pA1]